VTTVRVIGCGNRSAGDDALGILAVRAVAEELQTLGADVVAEVGPLSVIHLLEDVDVAILVDAIRTEGSARAPGEFVRLVASDGGIPTSVRSSLSSHGLGIAEVVALAAAVGRRPRVVVLGLEAEHAEAGAALSPAVERSLPTLESAVLDEARASLSA
jgi:hydrogenase maturation protease